MPKIENFGHPIVRLEFTGHDGLLTVRVVDDATGEELMSQTIKMVAQWLQDRHYKWVFGSNGKWVHA